MECVATTRSIADVIADRQFDAAMAMRGGSFTDSYQLLRTIVQARPRHLAPGQRALRLAVLHAGGPAPGMNTAVRVALRVAMDRGHTVLGVRDGFRGLLDGRIERAGVDERQRLGLATGRRAGDEPLRSRPGRRCLASPPSSTPTVSTGC